MAVGAVFAMTLPGLVVLLIALAVVERAYSRMRRRSPVSGERRDALSASGIDAFSAALLPGRATELEQKRVEEHLRDEEADGAPPRSYVDLDAGVARLRLPPRGAV
jgi:hypothetical protein